MKYYAGIGARSTPDNILNTMRHIATQLAEKNWTLRSGHAIGADRAFEHGCNAYRGESEIFVADDATIEAVEMASKFHPAWDRCKPYVQKLHGRNMMILLGQDLKTPCEMITCWTPNGVATGGTGQAMRLAADRGIAIYNLALDSNISILCEKYELKT